MAIAAAFFLGVFGLFVGIYWLLVLRPEQQAHGALKRRLRPSLQWSRSEAVNLLKRIAPLSTVPALEALLSRSTGLVGPMQRLIQRSGLQITVAHVVLGSILAALLGFILATQLTSSVAIGAVAGLLAGMVPTMVVRQVARRRIAKFEEQFPEAIDLIARALRAGHAFTTGLGMVADEVAEPVRSEFRLLYDKQNYGMPLGDALKGFAARIPLLDARFFVTAVLTQREAGGNLSEVLDSLAALIRDRFRLKRQVRVLSAHGRITGWVLACLPIVIASILFVIAPAHIAILFTDPIGIRMVVIVAVLQVIGFIAMRRIVDIEI